MLAAARKLGRPVKWVCDRTEHFLTDAQGRDNLVEAEMAMDAKGRFLALRINLVANMGAYISKNAIFIPFPFHECVNRLTLGLLDPHSRQPAYKQSAGRIERIADQHAAGVRNAAARAY